MTDIPPIPSLPPTLPPSPGRQGCMTALLVVSGVILLLSGLAALLYGAVSSHDGRYDGGNIAYLVVGLLVGSAGALLTWAAIRKPSD